MEGVTERDDTPAMVTRTAGNLRGRGGCVRDQRHEQTWSKLHN